MKKLIKDEMNINDIINHLDLNAVLYTGGLAVGNPVGNVIMVEYNNESLLDLASLPGLDYFNNEYIVLSISQVEVDTKRYIYLKQIPML